MLATILALAIFIFVPASSHVGAAQQPAKPLPLIGLIVSSDSSTDSLSPLDGFLLGLRELGYVEGRNILIERRYAEGRLNRMSSFVHEFVQQKVDVIIAVNNVAIQAAKEATRTIPIVMISSVDPVAAGFVESFTKPGGNITGLATMSRELSRKRMELLKESLPKMSRIAILWDADAPGPTVAFKEYEAAARAFKLELRSVEVHGPDPDFPAAVKVAKTARADALIVVGNPLMSQHSDQISTLAAKHRLPSMAEERRYVNAGNLISYGPSRADLHRQAATYVDKILTGAKPGELPVIVATKFETFINLKTAQQLGVTLPQHVLVQADGVIK